MALIIKDRIKEVTTTAGTGAITLGGASATFETFSSYMTNGDTAYYAIVHTASGVDEWEVGLGTWNTGNTFTRTTVIAGTNDGSQVNFSAGIKDIFMTYPASIAAYTDGSGDLSGDIGLGNHSTTELVEGSNLYYTDARVDAHLSGGTGVTYSSGAISIGQDVATTADVTFNSIDTTNGVTVGGDATIEGNLTVNGTTTTVNAENLAIADNLIYLNDGSTITNPDLGWSGNYNDGTYAHAGVFRDATDGIFKFFDGYVPEPDDVGIDPAHASYTDADIKFGTGYGDVTGDLTGNVTGNVTGNTAGTHTGPVVGDVTGDVTGNADTATALETSRTIQLTGDVIGSATFDGTANATITATVQDDSHAHVISNVDGLQSALDGKTTTGRTITAGGGLTGGGDLTANRTISHADTSTQASLTALTGAAVVSDVDVDTYGHVTNLATRSLTLSDLGYTGETNATADQTITAGSGLTGGGTGNVTISHSDTSSQASVNNSGRTYIQDITLDAFGHITGISSATETVVNTDTNTNQLTTFQVEDGDGTEVTISHGKEWKFTEAGGININWTDTDPGSDADPYDLSFNISTSITAGNGLTGGGALSSNQTLNVGAGSGITVQADTVSHADTSSQASVNGSGRTYIQDVTLDGFGHVTGLSTATETVTDTTYSAGSGLSLSGTTFSHSDTSAQGSVNNSSGTVIQDITLDTYGHLTGINSVNLDGRYYTESEADSRFVNASGDTITGDVYFNATTHWAVSASDAARQRADARDDATNFSRLHWYGHSDTGGTSNFRHAWYDGSSYVNVTVTSGRIDFTGSASSMYIGNDRVFDDGYHPNADKWTTARTLTLSGDVSGSTSWDGSGNASISVTVADDSHNHIISNVDGLQTALDGKLSTSGKAADSNLLDGIDSSAFLRSNTADTFTTLSGTQLNLGSQVQLAESSDRADLLQITSSTSSWAGLQIRNSSNEGRWSFMTDGEVAGIYNDEDNQWHIYMTEGQGVELRHASVTKLATTSTGIGMSGQIDMNNNDIVGVDQIIHEGDTDTYMQFHAADQWRVVTGGVERLEVNNSQITSTEPIHAPSFHGDGSSLTGIESGAKNDIFWENGQAVTSNYTITNGKNAMSAGPITINAGVTVTVGDGETWTVI